MLSPRPSPAAIALRRSAALKPPRGPPPRKPPDQNGIWGVSYLGRRGGPIETRSSSHSVDDEDDTYRRRLAAIQQSIELARQYMEPPPSMEPPPVERDSRRCHVRITIAHSRAARTWRVPWRVQMHYELEDGDDVHEPSEDEVDDQEAATVQEDIMEQQQDRPRRPKTREWDYEDETTTRSHRVMMMRAQLSSSSAPSSAR